MSEQRLFPPTTLSPHPCAPGVKQAAPAVLTPATRACPSSLGNSVHRGGGPGPGTPPPPVGFPP